MLSAHVLGIGFNAPGLESWEAAQAVLRGEAAWADTPWELPAPQILPARERRRTTETVRLALNVAAAAQCASGIATDRLTCTFASSLGDGRVLGSILEALATEEKLVSPTDFHNSVHNAAAGYWSIGTQARTPATTLAAGDYTAGAALLKALMQRAAGEETVLLTCFDCPLPQPLAAARPIAAPFGAALVLGGPGGPSKAELTLATAPSGQAATPPRHRDLLPLFQGNPAARLLPTLELLARGESGRLALGIGEGLSLPLEVRQ